LPLRNGSVDAAMSVLSVHHWDQGQERGVRELRRVATGPVVIPSGHTLSECWMPGHVRRRRALRACHPRS
jgi:hypothetical protein